MNLRNSGLKKSQSHKILFKTHESALPNSIRPVVTTVDKTDVLKIPKFYCRVKALCDDEDCIVSLKVLHET